MLPAARASGNTAYLAELLTQIARTEGLQGRFDAAHRTLDEAEALITPEMKRARVRLLLERGRAFNSGGQVPKARPLFLEAWEIGRAAKEDGLAVDAAHMVAIVESGDAALEWNLKALTLAQASTEPRAQRWQASLYNNLGWTYHDRKQYTLALEMFEKAVLRRRINAQPREEREAWWCLGRCLRSLGRLPEALEIQQRLTRFDQDGYVAEEMAECLLALGQGAKARPWFAKAHALLSADAWMVKNEAARLKRLQEMSQ
ncbi:MAG: tetratricopeptide repeat protein [Armatimonadetes bacterium]|nr:tetratricopeptide repeat protein [Armatimonadota bacterium]